ncbi:hypothetical protein DPMN_147642 [Dreissena polymorpha]|uniref:Uncharacterized protein n=1 Tax=Dreissena polymorpha TaxID=45954 RepID=A0A9D4FCK0_DREPO|nr:hypothetical protein DPMN_147642 [Dreissena polymorpha]
MDKEADGEIIITQLEVALFGNVITKDCVNSLGHIFSSRVFWHSNVITGVGAFPPSLISSEGTLSNSGDVPAFRLCTSFLLSKAKNQFCFDATLKISNSSTLNPAKKCRLLFTEVLI